MSDIMQYGTQMPNFGDIWRSLQRESNGECSARTIDDDEERKFWKSFIKRRSTEAKDDYSDVVMSAVNGILGDRIYDSILEIGPGWGNYTFDLATNCRSITCVDISPDVLSVIRERGREQRIWIDTVNSKWEDYSGKSADVIFGFNCFYRMRDIEDCIRKIDAKGNDLHIIGMTSGPEQEYYKAFHDRLGLDIKYDRLDYILLVNILYQQGIDCNLKIIPLQNEYVFPSMKQLIASETRRIMNEDYDRKAVERILRRYFERDADGMYHYVHRFNAALIYW